MVLSKHVVDGLARHPPNLKVAMEVWTLASIKGRMQNQNLCYLNPSADGLENAVPPKSRQQLFGLKRTAFFPEPNIILDKDSCHWGQRGSYLAGKLRVC